MTYSYENTRRCGPAAGTRFATASETADLSASSSSILEDYNVDPNP